MLVDFKPQNVLITDEAQISIIDLDSVQFSKNQQVLFAAKVATPEYTPKEGDKLNPANDYIPETWDRFSLAVVFYELLFGIHPYTATAKGQYHEVSTISEKISNNLFVHGSKKTYLTTIPVVHKNFDQLPLSLKSFFIAAFEEGNQIPSKRPSAEAWGQQIVTELRNSGVKPAQYKPATSSTPVSQIIAPKSNLNKKVLSTISGAILGVPLSYYFWPESFRKKVSFGEYISGFFDMVFSVPESLMYVIPSILIFGILGRFIGSFINK